MNTPTGVAAISLLLAPLRLAAETTHAANRFGPEPLQVTLALLLVLLIAVVCLLLLRRYGSLRPVQTRQFRILATLPLGQRERVVLLEAGGKQLILGVCPGRIDTLCILEGDQRLQAGEPDPSPDFGDMLRQLLQRQTT
jgi:flagellar protein FliO/FliZ